MIDPAHLGVHPTPVSGCVFCGNKYQCLGCGCWCDPRLPEDVYCGSCNRMMINATSNGFMVDLIKSQQKRITQLENLIKILDERTGSLLKF